MFAFFLKVLILYNTLPKSYMARSHKRRPFVTKRAFRQGKRTIRHINMQNIPETCITADGIIILRHEKKHENKHIMNNRTILGIILVAGALLKLADIWGLANLGWLWQQPWLEYVAPAVFLYIGVHLIIESIIDNRDQWLQRPLPIGDDGKRIRCSVHYGGDEYIYRGEAFHGARLDVCCGGIRLDLREATITEDEEIDIHTFCGGVELLIPPTVNVVVKSRSILGGIGNHTDRHVKPDAPCIHIIASNIIGGIDIRNSD